MAKKNNVLSYSLYIDESLIECLRRNELIFNHMFDFGNGYFNYDYSPNEKNKKKQNHSVMMLYTHSIVIWA